MKNRKNLLIAFIVFAVIGWALAYVSLLAHLDGGSGLGEFCSINDTFDCDVVNQSSYSEFLGIPVAALGMLAYAFFFVAPIILLVLARLKPSTDKGSMKKRQSAQKLLIDLMAFGAVIGLAFSLYLTSIEAFVLHTWCLYCIGSQLTILVITGLAFRLRSITRVI